MLVEKRGRIGFRVRALKAGASCFLAKPFAGEALIECLDAALQGHADTTSK